MPEVIVERSDRGMGAGIVVGLALVALAVVAVLFFVFGGPARFPGAAGAPGQTNVNVPAQNQPQSAPNITIPRQIDVNINQQPASQAPAPVEQAPAGSAPAGSAPAGSAPVPPAGTR